MALANATSSRRRLHPPCRVRMALALAAVFAFAFFLGRAPAGTSAPSRLSTVDREEGTSARPKGAAGTEAPALADVLRSSRPVRAPGIASSHPPGEGRTE